MAMAAQQLELRAGRELGRASSRPTRMFQVVKKIRLRSIILFTQLIRSYINWP